MSKMLTCMSNANIMHRADNHVHMLDININSDTALARSPRTTQPRRGNGTGTLPELESGARRPALCRGAPCRWSGATPERVQCERRLARKTKPVPAAAPSRLREVGGGVALQPSAYAVPPSSVAGAGRAAGSATPQRRRAPWLRRRPFTKSVGHRDATFGRGSSLSPRWATWAPPGPFPTVLHAWSCLVVPVLRWSVVIPVRGDKFPVHTDPSHT